MKYNIVTRKDENGKKTYWIPSPWGGGELMQIPKEEMEEGLANGTLQHFKPAPGLLQIVQDEMREERDS